MGDWPLSDELVMVRDMARRFMRNDVKPAEDQVEHDAIHLPDHLLKPLQQKARDGSSA